MDGYEADLAPARVEQVGAVRRACQPELQRADGTDVGGRPEQVLADGPAPVAAGRVERRDPAREGAAVRGIVAEVPEPRHLGRMSVRCGGERRRDSEREKVVGEPER